MEAEQRRRRSDRRSFKNAYEKLLRELGEPNPDKGELLAGVLNLEDYLGRMREADDRILELMIKENVGDDIFDKECDEKGEFIEQYRSVEQKVKSRVKEGTAPCSVNTSIISENGAARAYRLPKMELTKFDGKLVNWLGFWAQFERIHLDAELQNIDKFHYLAQAMESGTRVKEMVDAYPRNAENYTLAIEELKERFGNKERLKEVYVRELLGLVIDNARRSGKERLGLDRLCSRIESNLRALKSLELDMLSNEAWLYPMIESILSSDLLKAWQRSVGYGEVEGSRLSRLMQFVRKEVEGDERIREAAQGLGSGNKGEGNVTNDRERADFRGRKDRLPTAAGLFAGEGKACLFCDRAHESQFCLAAQRWSREEKLERLRAQKACFRCLGTDHISKYCKERVRCQLCERGHIGIMCPELNKGNKQDDKVSTAEEINLVQNTHVKVESCNAEIALMTLEVMVTGERGTKRVRAVLDSGAQKSYIKESVIAEIGGDCVGVDNLAHALFGGVRTEVRPHNKYKLKVRGVDIQKGEALVVEVLGRGSICSGIPRVPKDMIARELKENKIWLSDINPGSDEIEMLVGSNVFGKIQTGRVKQLECGLTAMETILGWTVCGQIEGSCVRNTSASAMVATNLLLGEFSVTDLWSLETIGIKDTGADATKAMEEEAIQSNFLRTIQRTPEGRYCVGLPWLGRPHLPSHREMAGKRLRNVTRRLNTLGIFKAYDEVFRDWMKEGVIEKVSPQNLVERGTFLPHHPVIKPDSLTTKVRPVFDASFRMPKSPSLNDCLMKGPNLIEKIPAVLLRFRENPIAVVSDIRRAFLQIAVKDDDRHFLRFLWWEDGQQQVFQHNRVVFGVTCSPFLLGAVIAHHLSQAPEELKAVAQRLLKAFYVDNCVTSVEDEESLCEFVTGATRLMADAGMDLRMWEFGPSKALSERTRELEAEGDSSSVVPVLGLSWNREDDTLAVLPKISELSDKLSKRELLSFTQSVFDPIGFLTPLLVPAKLIVQEAWADKSPWDTPVKEELNRSFKRWLEGMRTLSEIRLPRRIGYGQRDTWSLHVFCDASQGAYATVIFLRSEQNEEVFVRLVGAKSRLAPLKKMTIPRLELMACLIGVRLRKFLLETLELGHVETFLWTDSATALAWIRRNDQWGTFVGNRVQEIREDTTAGQWRFVPGRFNPADLPSRGCSVKTLQENRWWEGPRWLYETKNPNFGPEVTPDETMIAEERKRNSSCVVMHVTNDQEWYESLSRYSRIVRVFCWVRRACQRLRKEDNVREGVLSCEEREEAEKILWKGVQEKYLSVKGSVVGNLPIIKDDDGMIRVKTKIVDRDDTFDFRCPILLPSKHHLVRCLIRELHLRNSHAGVQVMATILRENYWIVSAKRNVRHVLSQCVVCKRYKSKAGESPPIHLPQDRVKDSKVFETVGIDLCGPLYLKNKCKVWIVLFTCAVFRAVHLELVSSLSTDVFLQSFRRFIARRGRPRTVYSDNGTNFTGANNSLKAVDWERLTERDPLDQIRWKFIPPTAAWWGGWWERLIRTIKELLVRVLGKAALSYEELCTVLCDVEGVINSRPLTYVSEDPDELVPLSPSLFLNELGSGGTPDLDYIDHSSLNVRLKHCQNLREELRSRFRKEYLGQLVLKAGENSSDIAEGDVVLIGGDRKRMFWPMAKVLKILKSRDGYARVAKLQLQNGTLVRPIKRLYPLEVTSKSEPVVQVYRELRSRSGRTIRPPRKMDL